MRRRDDVASTIRDVHQRVIQRRLPCTDTQGRDAAFQSGNALFQNGGRRIGDPAIAEPLHLKVEKRGAVIGAVEFIRDGLIDWHGDSFRRRVSVIPRMNR